MDHTSSKREQFVDAVAAALAQGSLVKVALRQPVGPSKSLKSIDIRPIEGKHNGIRFALVEHHATKDITKTLEPEAGLAAIAEALTDGFRQGYLHTTESEVLLDLQGKMPRLHRRPASAKDMPSLRHNREKARAIPADAPWLAALGVTDAAGRVLKSAADKYRQINRYVEILGPMLKDIPPDRLGRIVDMGAGKGYLTFAVADFVARTLGRETEVVGVELRPELVEACRAAALSSGVRGLRFEAGSIEGFDATGADVLIALHACDTATDDAIAKGIASGAELIVVAPCCHKQIRREIEASNQATALDFVTRHGIFLERQAEMVTDAVRAMILEHFGYATKVFEFVSDAHTPKNVMITARRVRRAPDPAKLEALAAAKAFFGIRRHYLETATGL